MADRTGQQFGDYRLIRPLGAGTFADVYLAEQMYLKTQVAIKILQEKLSGQGEQQFLEEAQTIAHLNHPHIVGVSYFGIEKNMPFMVMDYAPNGTLRQRYPKGTVLSLALVISYV